MKTLKYATKKSEKIALLLLKTSIFLAHVRQKLTFQPLANFLKWKIEELFVDSMSNYIEEKKSSTEL